MKKTQRGKKPILFISLILVTLLLFVVGCGGGAVPPVADAEYPVIHEMKYDGDNGTNFISDKRGAEEGTLYVKASDNQTSSNQLTFDIKNGNGEFISQVVTKGNDGYYEKEVQLTPQDIYTNGNFDVFDATARVRDASGNGTFEKNRYMLALSNASGVQQIEEGLLEKNPDGSYIFDKMTFKINGVHYEFEKGGQWRSPAGHPYVLFLRYDAVSENNLEMPEDKKIYDSNGLKIYQSDNIQAIVGEINPNLNESQIKDLSKIAVDFFKDYYNF